MVVGVCMYACLKFTLHVEKEIDGEMRKNSYKSRIRRLK